MANSDVIDLIISLVGNYLTYMLPILAVLTALTFIFSFLYAATLGAVKDMFRDR